MQPYIILIFKYNMFLSCSFIVFGCCFCLLYSGFVIIAVHASLSAPFTSNYCHLFFLCFVLVMFLFVFCSDSSNHKHVICY